MSFRSAEVLRKRIVLLLIVVACLVGLAIFVFQPRTTVKAQDAPKSCPTCSPAADRVIYAPTIGFSGTGNIVLNCRSIHEMEAVPTFYTEKGEAVVGDTIKLQAGEMQFVTIASLIPASHRGQKKWGGMSLSYFGSLMEVWAQISLPNKVGSTDVTFFVPTNSGSDIQDAVWWQPKGSQTIALGNSSDSEILTKAIFSDGEIEEVVIAPHGTEYLKRKSAKLEGGASVKLITQGPAGSLRPIGIVEGDKTTSSIRFYSGAVQPKLFATNFTNSQSHLVLKNTTDRSVNAQAVFRNNEGEAIPLEAVTLSAGEIKELNLKSLPDEIFSVEVTNDGVAGSLIGSLVAKNLDVPLRDSGPTRTSTGAYPWRVDKDYQTKVSITNVGLDATVFNAILVFEGGEYSLGSHELGGGKTRIFDINEIRSAQIADRSGNVIPLDITKGQFRWSIARTKSEEGKLIGRSQVTSVSEKVSSSYSCPMNCPQTGPIWGVMTSIPNFSMETGDDDTDTLTAAFQDGYGYWYYEDGIPYLSSLGTADGGVASITTNGSDMVATGASAGFTTWSSEYWYSTYVAYEEYCDDQSHYDDVQGNIESKPKVTITVPSSANDGSTVTFSSTVTGGVSPTSYTWSYTPTSGGNNPNLSLTASSSANTNATAKWWASPNNACTASTSSDYTVKLTTTFANHGNSEKTKTFTVNVPWTVGGVTTGEWSTSGSTTRGVNGSGQWVNTGIGTYSITTNGSVVYNVPTTSQFRNKVEIHEGEHVTQWQPGNLFGAYFTNAGLWTAIQNVTAASESALIAATAAATITYATNAGATAKAAQCNQGEIDAYAVSDSIAPQYLYQRCGGQTTWPQCQ